MKYKTIIDKMSLEEKAAMMSGRDTWTTVAYEKYNIPSIFLSDGPHGLRKQAGAGDHLGLHASLPATCYPTAATMANSWDVDLAEQLGEHLGEEAAALGVHIVLGPGLNIKRSPLCGRNFEYFSEDPLLSGKMAAAYIRGIQSKGVGACPKHFAANSQEERRMATDSVLDERTLREIYTVGFEIAVKEGHPLAIMTSYNQVNGVYANEHPHLLGDLLYGEWKFDGIVVSDWGGSNDHVEGVRQGSHLEMPSTGKMGAEQIVRAVQEGRLSEDLLDERIEELLHVVYAVSDAEKRESFDREKHHRFARKAAAESVVLLKNEGNLLPLCPGTKVAVIGDFARTPRYQGAGSSLVNPTALDTALGEIAASGLTMTCYARGFQRNAPANDALLEEAIEAAKGAEVVLLYVGLDEISESEGLDRAHMRMPESQLRLIEAVTAVNEKVVVVLSAGSAVEMPWIAKVRAVVHGYLGGQAGAGAMLDVLTGKVCPSGKLAETYPLRYEDTPSAPYYPAKERSSEYREGLYVGYRYFDTVDRPTQFSFGYGLSYTSFAYGELDISKEGVSLTITNTGAYDGAEVVQMYVGKRDRKVFGPRKELKGFAKIFLKKGESGRVFLPFDERTFRYFDRTKNAWATEGGVYQIYVGASVTDIRREGIWDYGPGTAGRDPYEGEELPSYRSGNIRDVSDEEYRGLYGGPLPDGRWDRTGLLGKNDAICQMFYAKNPIARLVWKILESRKKASEKRGKPDLNILFIYNMPFRGISKMTGGAVNEGMVEGILTMVNGHFFRGMGALIAAAIRGK